MRISLFLLVFGLCTAIQAQDTSYAPIEIVYDDATAMVTIPDRITDVEYEIDGADVKITSNTTSKEYTYRVSGTSSNGSLCIIGSYKLTLELAGVNLTSTNSFSYANGAAIDVECGKRIDLVLVEGTVNTLIDSEFGSDSHKSALYFKGHADFKGGGTLNVTGKYSHAICAKEEIEFKSSLGCINVLGAVKDGIHCGKGKIAEPDHNYFQMDGGTVNIVNVFSDGIDTDDYGSIIINGGGLSINVSGESSNGMKADKDITINGGDINILVSAKNNIGFGRSSEGIKADNNITINDGNIHIVVSADGSKGIKAKKDDNATTGGNLEITGGNIDIYVTGNSYEKTTDSGTNTSNCIGISVDNNMTQSGGNVVVTAMGSETKGINVKGTNIKTDGTLKVTHGPWLLAPSDYEFEMSVYVRVYKNDEPVTDYSNLAIGAFIGTECMGLAEFDQTQWGIARVYYDATDDDPVYFKLYDNTLNREFVLTADREVLFEDQEHAGTPSNPVKLSYEMRFTPGDVNMDGYVDVADITAIAYHYFGTTPAVFNYDAADVNQDGFIDVADITAISYIYFSQNAKPRINQLDPQ